MYRDDSDKPEMIVALSRFEALCGFAPIEMSTQLLQELGWIQQAQSLSTLGISGYLKWAFQQPTVPTLQHGPPWLQKIFSLHPGDKALLIAPLMNHVILNEGEALCLPAGNLHAYLNGFGLEVMSSSDNVIRAGFTSKHVDIEEVLRIVDTRPLENPIVHIGDDDVFPSPSPAFTVARATTSGRFSSHHRIAFGNFSAATLPHKEMCFLQAGDEEELTDDHGYVCIQN
jgi:mannose-6-phosphate isomerase